MTDLRPDLADALELMQRISTELREIDPHQGFPDHVGAPLCYKNANHAQRIAEHAQELEALFSSMAVKAGRTVRP